MQTVVVSTLHESSPEAGSDSARGQKHLHAPCRRSLAEAPSAEPLAIAAPYKEPERMTK